MLRREIKTGNLWHVDESTTDYTLIIIFGTIYGISAEDIKIKK